MTEHDDLRADLPADADSEEAAALRRVAERLRMHRAVPSRVFRGNLRRRLLAAADSRAAPARLRPLIAATGGSGAVMLLIVAASVAGVGPLAA
jgi:hypothetical protein